MVNDMFVREGGSGEDVLLLLHGLGATGEVWRGLEQRLTDAWPGRWVSPDLPGHGRSGPLAEYSFGGLAAAVAPTVTAPTGRVVVLGHSLGGVLALTLASGWFGFPVHTAIGLGMKVRWSADELAKAAALAARPGRVFDTRDEAADRWLKLSGLSGLVALDQVDAGVQREGEGWRAALDQRAFGVGAPDLPGLLAAARAEIRIAAGEHDPMSPADHLPGDAVILPGLGHNAHVEDPEAVLSLLG